MNREIKSRGILFTAPMICAILNGSKTQTRRIVKPQPESFYTDGSAGCLDAQGDWIWHRDGFTMAGVKNRFGIPGDQLWCKETWFPSAVGTFASNVKIPKARPEGWTVLYRASGDEVIKPLRWKPSIFMPRWASRITLEIVSVGVERLQDISEADAKAEGIEGRWHPKDPQCWTWKDYARSKQFNEPIFHYGSAVTPQSTYAGLWDSINGKGSWSANPWVFVIAFRRIKP